MRTSNYLRADSGSVLDVSTPVTLYGAISKSECGVHVDPEALEKIGKAL